MSDDGYLAPSREDPLVRASSEVVGGPMGRRGRPHSSWWTPVRVLVLMAVAVAGLGWLPKEPCRSIGWGGDGIYTHLCYSDMAALYVGRGLSDGVVPYVQKTQFDQVEYPVLTGAVMYLAAKLTPASAGGRRGVWFYDVNGLLIAIAGVVTVVAVARTHRRRPWDAAFVALSPGILLAGTINWDMWAAMLTATGSWAWARRRPVLAGVLIGLGTAAKFYPLLLLGPLLVGCLRAGRMRELAKTVLAAAAAWAAVNVPVMIVNFQGWSRFYALSSSRTAGFSSPWYVADILGWQIPDGRLNLVAGGTFLVLCVVIALLGLTAVRRPRLPQLMFLTLAAFLLTNKVYSPQYVVWLVPIAALARPRWRDYLVWQAGEVVHFVGIWLYIYGFQHSTRGLPPGAYSATVVAHILGTLWMCVMVVRDIVRPDGDPVRADGSDDPAGGVLDGAPDAFHLRIERVDDADDADDWQSPEEEPALSR